MKNINYMLNFYLIFICNCEEQDYENKIYLLKIAVFIRRQIERNKLAREKQLREAAEREKAAMEQRLLQYQEEIRLANEALVRKKNFKIINDFPIIITYINKENKL